MNLPVGITNEENSEARDIAVKIKGHLQEGDSITVARRKACGVSLDSKRLKIVMHHPIYIMALNEYMIRIGKNAQYVLVRDKLVPLKRFSA